jgi:hypothetical protein
LLNLLRDVLMCTVQTTMHLVSFDKDKIKSIIVKIDSLKFSIQNLNYGILYKTFRPQATTLIKKWIQ